MLEAIDGPEALRRLDGAELAALAGEIRAVLIEAVSVNGGHLGSNLGAVELTLALHRVFDSPRDAIVWDTGHQSYVHKLVTGRQDFSKLRLKGGTLVFTDNVLFNSPSAAASVVCGYAANGRVLWRTADGKTLKEIEAEQVAPAE